MGVDLLHLLPEHPDQPPQVQLRGAVPAPVVQPDAEAPPLPPLPPPAEVHTPAAGQGGRGQRLELLRLYVPAPARGRGAVNFFA